MAQEPPKHAALQLVLPMPFVLLVALALLASPEARAEGPAVIVAEATVLSFPLTVEALGTARANESVEIRPQISQRITAIRFEEGAAVQAGDVLVQLRDAEPRAAVSAARAALVESEGQLRRARQLIETRAISAADLEQRTARRDADRAALDTAEVMLTDTVVRAPFAGRVGLRRVSLGSLVTPETVITTLDDTDPMKLDFDVPETALARLEPGLPVKARSAAFPDRVFEGVVASIDTRVDPVSRTLTVRALLSNEEERLLPGMFLTVQLLREDVSALLIPEQAIVPEQSRQYVWVMDGDGRVSKREVRTGRRRPGLVEVLSGLAAGERVIVEGTQKARPGATVDVVGTLPVGPIEPQSAP
jgi:membrane fusion protein (multidrug efflux system)